MTEIKTTRKRQRELDDDQYITPTPFDEEPSFKHVKTQQEELSPFENIAQSVIEYGTYPFLESKDLAELSKVSQLQRASTEDQRAIRYEQMERKKRQILNEIAQDNEMDIEEANSMIDKIWEIPFHSQNWNRPSIVNSLRTKAGYIDGQYYLSKFTMPEFMEEIITYDYLAYLISIVIGIIKSKNISRQQKETLLQAAGNKINKSIRIYDWIEIHKKVKNEPDRDLLKLYVENFFKKHPNARPIASVMSPFDQREFIQSFSI